MSKGRAWRRHCEDKVVIRRLKNRCRRWYRFHDVNGHRIDHPTWLDFIGTQEAYKFKTYTTNRYDSRYKSKWGKKNKRSYYFQSDPWTRTQDKRRFLKELKEYGLKPRNPRYQPELDYQTPDDLLP